MPVGPGTILQNRYEVTALLDSGGMGQVWRGEDGTLRRPVAIKVMRSGYADQGSFERFVREARVAASLDHPGITSVYDFGRHEDQYFIVMQLLRGQDLKAALQEHPAGLPVQQAVGYAVQAAEALAAAHEAGVIHRDLKPANLFIVAGDRLKICDFGIAKHADATRTLTQEGAWMGTPAYMSPEQWEGRDVDARSDLYSLGCVLYELLTSQPPFGSDLTVPALYAKHVEVIPQPPQADAYLPAGLSDLVLRMLAKDPAQRPQTASELAGALKEIDFTPPEPQPPQPSRPERPALLPETAEIADKRPGRLISQRQQRLRGWSATARVSAWLVFGTTISLAIGARFGVESLNWLWMLVPLAVVTGLDAFVSVDIEFDSGSQVAWTLTTLGATAGSVIALVTGYLAPATGIPIAAVSSIVAFFVLSS